MAKHRRSKFDVHRCNECGETEETVNFNTRVVNGRTYKRHLCSSCDSKRSGRYPRNREVAKRAEIKQANKRKQERKSNINTHNYIWVDSRRLDKKRGLENDLTKDFIASMLKMGCCYCGETEGRITLDRIDNKLGHTKANVVPACIRCNYFRCDMPHAAWLLIAEAMRKAKDLGLFGDWSGRAR